MRRFLRLLAFNVAILAPAAAPALGQAAPPAAQPSGSPPPARRSAESVPGEKQIEGPVQRVDPAAKTIEVGGVLGRTTLQVTDDTLIRVLGQKVSLREIEEGTKVQASYEPRDGQNVAKAIEVLPTLANLTREGGGMMGE